MDKLSKLISQARPLYKQRKRRKTIAKLLFAITIPMIAMINLTSLYIEGNNLYMSFENNTLQNELISDDIDILGIQ